MTEPKNNNTKLLHTTGIYEGISFLVLLFIAMPLKYFANLPMAVTVVGGLHGVLFIAFAWFNIQCISEKSITMKQGVIAFLLSLLPTGTFFLKRVIG